MLYEILKNKKAFSFIEALIVIIIIGICILIWGFYGRDHIRVAMMTEAKMFTEKIIGQEKVYYADKGCFFDSKLLLTKSDILFVDTKENKYFKSFRLTRPKSTLGTVIVDLYPDTAKYPDMGSYSIKAVFMADKDIIDYQETYGT